MLSSVNLPGGVQVRISCFVALTLTDWYWNPQRRKLESDEEDEDDDNEEDEGDEEDEQSLSEEASEYDEEEE